jgi:DNA polymerase
VLAALAGEQWVLDVHHTHGMIYEASASKITGIPFDEFVRHKRETGKHHPKRNTLGKFAELASGFGGWIGAWKQFGADEYLTDEEIKRAILAWREASPAIVEMWGGQTRGKFSTARQELFGLEGAAISAIKNPGQAFSYRDVVYQTQGDALYCRVPDGGLLTYHAPRLRKSTRPYAEPWEVEISYEGYNTNPKQGPTGWIRMHTYGGKLFENVVQKIARYFQAKALVRLERAGYRPVLHSHDEGAGEVPKGWGSVEEFERIGSECPHPAYAGWPIRMKGGWRHPRYGKFE